LSGRLGVTVRRPLGYFLFVFGGLLLSFAGGRYAVGMLRADAARRAWNEASAKEAVTLVQSVAMHGWPAGRIVDGSPIARILIPRIDLDEIVLEGVDDEALNAGPGHLPGSAFPGERGNAVISAHRDRHFNRLDMAEVGDTIHTESGRHANTWVIVSKRVVRRDRAALFTTSDATLTLTTCWPIRYLGSAPDRLILTAKPLEPHRTNRAATGPTLPKSEQRNQRVGVSE
jgi:LPXTG-site transpeptidase (sortase) family protein